jgi:signal transduction histidine kinase
VQSALERLENPLAIEETEGDPRANANRTAALGIHSLIDIGIMAGNEVFGKLTAFNMRRRRFSAEDRRLFTSLSRRAGLAIENARLFGEARERTQQLAALYRADEELHRSLELDEVMKALLSTVIDTFEADNGSVVLWEPGDIRPRMIAVREIAPEAMEAALSSFEREGRESYLRALQSGEVHAVEDTTRSSRMGRERSIDIGVHSLIEAPLRVDGELVGHVVAVWMAPRAFSQEEQRLMAALARRAEVAIDNARLYSRAQSLAAVEERQRLARELHDSVSQALYGIALGSRTARTLLDRDAEKAKEPVDYVLSLAEAGLAEMRALIFELRPESLEQEGLVAAIEKQVASTRARYGVQVEANLCEEPDVPLNLKEVLYRVAQEALHNVVKHARASQVDLELACHDGHVVLDLRDDGLGFDPSGDFPGHLGLGSMRERVTRVGGEFVLESEPGKGTHLRAEVG